MNTILVFVLLLSNGRGMVNVGNFPSLVECEKTRQQVLAKAEMSGRASYPYVGAACVSALVVK